MQFGYKKGHSTTVCTLVYKEVISHYVNNNTSVYSCLLDASKPFDSVTWLNYLAYCYIKISPQQSLDYILTVIPDKRLVLVGTILCLNISLCQTE